VNVSTQDSAANYVELTGQAYLLVVDAFAAVNRSRLGYWKSVWEIASKPYASTAIDSTVRENFDRAGQLADLTVAELRARGQISADFSEKFLSQIGKLQDSALETFRASLKTYASAMNQLKDATTELSGNGVKPREKPATLAPVSN
jgi:hypothetical protein